MSKVKAKTKSIVVALDMRTDSAEARHRTAMQAKIGAHLAHSLKKPLKLIYAADLELVRSAGKQYRSFADQLLQKEMEELESLGEKHAGHIPFSASVLEGAPTPTLIKLTAGGKSAPEILVLGTQSRTGFSRILLGSVAEEVVRHSRIPVALVGPHTQSHRIPEPGAPAGGSIVIATDLGKNSQKAEALGVVLAKSMGANEIILVHSLYESYPSLVQTALAQPTAASELADIIEKSAAEAEKKMKKRATDLAKKKMKVQTLVDRRSTSAEEAILGAVQPHTRWVVLGTYGRSSLAKAFLGSTTRGVIAHGQVPVLVVPS